MDVLPGHALGGTRPPTARWAPWARWGAGSGAAGVAIAALYLGLYRRQGFSLPVGFDAPWYVWRARYVGSHGLGALGTAARPGHEVLAALLGAVTGREQVELAVLLPPVLAAAFALALGAVLWSGLGPDARRWLVAVAAGGSLLGATRLVDENVATLLFLAILMAALVPLIEHAANAGRPRRSLPFLGAVVLLSSAGLAHWLFLAVFAGMLGVAVLVLVPRARRMRSSGEPWVRTEAGSLAAVGAAVAGAMALLIGVVLRAPVDTIELREDPSRFLPKLRTDVARLFVPGLAPVAAGGAVALASDRASRTRVVLMALFLGWAVVSLAGIAYGAATLNLPPHRFLELLAVVPGVAAMAEAVTWSTSWVRRRAARAGLWIAWVLSAAAAAALVLPGALGWYRSGSPTVWIDAGALQQAQTASAYVGSLPPDAPFVFLVSPFGPAGTLSVPLKERTIRMALPAGRQAGMYLFPGEPSDALAGRRTLAPGAATNAATLPYWQQVRRILPQRPPILILQAFAPQAFAEATGAAEARVIGPGVALLRGSPPDAALVARPVPSAFPGIRAAVAWAAALLIALFGAGAGWTWLFIGPSVRPAVLFGLAPAAGAGMLVLAGVLLSRAGVALGAANGAAIVAGVAVTGLGLAAGRWWRARSGTGSSS